MPENGRRILEMLAEKKITVEAAERLLALTASEDAAGNAGPEGAPRRKGSPKYLRVKVTAGSGAESIPEAERVNVRVPMNLIRAGMKLTALIPPDAADKVHDAFKENGVDFDLRNLKSDDIEELVAALSDLEVDVESGTEKVHVWVE